MSDKVLHIRDLLREAAVAWHERNCSKTMFPCRCECANDRDFEKYGELFQKIELPKDQSERRVAIVPVSEKKP